jgi:hypothetical protein
LPALLASVLLLLAMRAFGQRLADKVVGISLSYCGWHAIISNFSMTGVVFQQERCHEASQLKSTKKDCKHD